MIDHRDQLATLLIGHRSLGAQGLELFLRAGTGGIRQTLRMVRQEQDHLDIGALWLDTQISVAHSQVLRLHWRHAEDHTDPRSFVCVGHCCTHFCQIGFLCACDERSVNALGPL